MSNHESRSLLAFQIAAIATMAVATISLSASQVSAQKLLPAKSTNNVTTGSKTDTKNTEDVKDPWVALSGNWTCISAHLGGKSFPQSITQKMSLSISKTGFVTTTLSGTDRGIAKLVEGQSPLRLIITSSPGTENEKKAWAIFRIEGDQLEIAYSELDFPTEFEASLRTGNYLVKYKRKPANR